MGSDLGSDLTHSTRRIIMLFPSPYDDHQKLVTGSVLLHAGSMLALPHLRRAMAGWPLPSVWSSGRAGRTAIG